MSIIETERPQASTYALGHTPEEDERLRLQARVWETATGRLLGQVGRFPGRTVQWPLLTGAWTRKPLR